MSQLRESAIEDAKIHYKESEWLSPQDWTEYVSRVRSGVQVGPAAEVLAEVGKEALCRAWGVPFAEWWERSGAWFTLYNHTFLAAIEVLVIEARASKETR